MGDRIDMVNFARQLLAPLLPPPKEEPKKLTEFQQWIIDHEDKSIPMICEQGPSFGADDNPRPSRSRYDCNMMNGGFDWASERVDDEG